MLTVAIALLVVIICIALLWKREQKEDSNPETTIPGYKKGSKDAPIFDVKDTLNQTAFLKELHTRFGPIASFWDRGQLNVSVGSPELFKETRNMSDVPTELLEPFRDLLGDDSFTFLSSEEAIERRKLYDSYFIMRACKTHFNIIKEVAEEFASKWETLDKTEQIPLMESVTTATQKAILCATFGETFSKDEILNSFKKEMQLIGNNSGIALKPNTLEYDAQHAAIKKIRSTVQLAIEERRKELEDGSDSNIFIDVLLDENIPDGQRNSDAITFFLGSETILFFFIWQLYHLITESELQDRLYEELKTVLGNEPLTIDNYSKLTYLRQVIDENLRYHGAIHTGRVAEKDMTVGGHLIPEGTPVYQYLGAAHHNPSLWNNPEQFDPDHFTRENCKGRHAYAFKPFGFAGKRVCPGMSFSYMLMITFTAIWFRKFKISLAPGETLVTSKAILARPEKELMLLMTPRN